MRPEESLRLLNKGISLYLKGDPSFLKTKRVYLALSLLTKKAYSIHKDYIIKDFNTYKNEYTDKESIYWEMSYVSDRFYENPARLNWLLEGWLGGHFDTVYEKLNSLD